MMPILRRQTYEGDKLSSLVPHSIVTKPKVRIPKAPKKKNPIVSRLTPDEYNTQLGHEYHDDMMNASTTSVYSEASGVDLDESRMNIVVGDIEDPRSKVSEKKGELVKGGRRKTQRKSKKLTKKTKKSRTKSKSRRRKSHRRRRHQK